MSTIYILRAIGTGKIKIGISDDVTRRMGEIQAMCPVPLELVDTLEHSDFEMEATMHRLSSLHWSHGEWFDEAALERVLRHFEIVRAANEEMARLLAKYVPQHEWPKLMELLPLCSLSGLLTEFTNITGQSIMDRGAA